jgi:penicillin V acylase-like amidase (Ntn superfamily)
MKKIILSLVVMIAVGLCIVQDSRACSTFCIKKGKHWLVGHNYDWMVQGGLVMINKQGISKTAVWNPSIPMDTLAKWTSKYASVTFNQSGREKPASGMNEAGLVISILFDLGPVQYPAPDSKPSAPAGQWLQYQLDNFATVQEMIQSDKNIRLSAGEVDLATVFPSHYFACDRKGECVVVEFIKGQIVFYTGQDLPVKALANSPYLESLYYLNQGVPPAEDISRSFERFIIVAKSSKNPDSGSGIDFTFNTLNKAASTDIKSPTQWSIVYDLNDKRVYFRTLTNNKKRYLDLNKFKHSCQDPVKIHDLMADIEGDVSDKFIAYSRQANRDLIGNYYSKLAQFFSVDITEIELDRRSADPENAVCCPCQREGTPFPCSADNRR